MMARWLRYFYKFLKGKVGLGNVVAILIVLILMLLAYRYRYYIAILYINQGSRELFFNRLVEMILNSVSDFITLTLSIIVEALPFVALGVLISVLIQVLLPTQKIIKYLPKNVFIRRLLISCLGILMPVCECGNVPVARGLIARGFSVQEGIIFLLAAPSVNIITFIITWEAFSPNYSIAIGRVVATIVIANIVALLVARLVAKNKLLTPEFVTHCEVNDQSHRTIRRATNLFHSEMWLIVRLLVIGAMIAAASQVFIPREVVAAIGSDLVLSVLAMLILAFIISICSSVDAFFALAYANTFGPGAILAFLIAGPMVDIKMIALMRSTFTIRTITVIATSVLVLSFIVGIGFSYVG